MPGSNDFLTFAGSGAANVITQAAYEALTAQQNGFLSGIANSDEFNKVWRQSSIIAASVAQAIADITGQNVVDDGTTATIIANFKAMLAGGVVTTLTATGSITEAEAGMVLIDASSASVVGTLPAASALPAMKMWIYRIDTTVGNSATIQRAGSDTIDGATSLEVDSSGPILLVSDGVSEWYNMTPRLGHQIQPIDVVMASNAVTVTLNPTTLEFRSVTLGSGVIDKLSATSPVSMNISAGSTLGTISGQSQRIIVLALNVNGVIKPAVVNENCGINLDETGLISTTAEGGAGAADSATVVYSDAAYSNVPYRVVGFFDSTQVTAGTWAASATTVQGFGGQALGAMASIGYGQTAQGVGRSINTTYYNTTGKPIMVMIKAGSNGGNGYILPTINGVQCICGMYNNSNATVAGGGTFIVPAGASYSVTLSGGTSPSITAWYEIR